MKHFIFNSKWNFYILTAFCIFIKLVSTQIITNKCCAEDEVIDVNNMKCRSSGEIKWTPKYYMTSDDDTPLPSDGDGGVVYQIKTKIPKCSGTGVHILPLRDLPQLSTNGAVFRLLADGGVVGKHSFGHWINFPENYCVDGIQNFGEGELYMGNELDQAIITCPVKSESGEYPE